MDTTITDFMQAFVTQIPHDDEKTSNSCWCPKRYILAGMLFIGFFVGFSLRANMSIAIIEMTANRTEIIDGRIVQYEPEFPWNSKIRSLVLNMNSYGFLFSIVMGITTRKCGGITTYGYALFLAGVITVLNPMIVRFNFHLFLISRFIEEIFASSIFVSVPEIWSRWTPKKERSRLLSYAFTGTYVSNAISFSLCGFASRYWGWPAAFYLTGGMAILISSTIMLSFSNDPFTDRCISKKELKILTQDLESPRRGKISYQWKEILTMKSLWGLFMAKIGNICAYTFVSICLPLYVKDMTGHKIDDVGILSGVPNVINIITTPIAGYVADYILNKNILTATQVHKLYTLIGLGLGAVCLFAISLTSNFTVIMIFLVLLKISISINYLVILLLPLYMAPDHSSVISSITVYGAGVGMTITTMLIGYVVTSHDRYQWSICLNSIAVIMLVACAIFLIFGSSEVQDPFWIHKSEEDTQNTEPLRQHELESIQRILV